MRTKGRRRLDVIVLGLGAVAGGGIVAIGGVVGDAERVTQYWAGAELRETGDAKVVEVIDYDFGVAIERHGIFRTIPGLSVETAVRVHSASAPDDIAERSPFTFDDGRRGLKLKIGDPDTTIGGRHRYQLASTQECTARQVEPGHLVVETRRLDTGEGVSIESGRGADLATAPTLPAPPLSAPPDPGIGLAVPAAAAVAAGLGSALSMSKLVRRTGRERVGAGGVSDAAWAGAGGPTGEVRLDEAELGRMATTEFAPPAELTPAQGGVLLAERVQAEHKVAWLIQAAIDGAIDLVEEDRKAVKIVRTGILGALLMVLGALLAFAGGFAANRWGRPWIVVVVVGSLLGGGGFAAMLRGWELRVRTPLGSGLWLRVESFRRFLHESETFHAEEAAKRGVLREYTAWAVALGEIDRWERAVAGSTIISADAGLGYVLMAPILVSSTSSTANAPSSSSGGGGGGSVGGGGGGGGGGSW